MQIAITIDDDQVDELDRLVPREFASRSEVVRTAITAWLAEQRASAVDRQYREAYAAMPPSQDEVDSGRMRTGRPAPAGWEELDW